MRFFKTVIAWSLVSIHFAGSPGFGQRTEDCACIAGRLLPAPRPGAFQMEGYWVWGSSVIKGEDNLYHMFVSRWPQHLPFHPGWMIASEIVHALADRPEGPYRFSEVALPARGAQYWDGRSTHNPKITKYKDTHVLFYMGSTHPFADVKAGDKLAPESEYAAVGRSNKRIGIATSKSPFGPWERRDAPVLDAKPNTFYSFLTSNPAPWIHEDGSVLLLFKSRAYKDTFPYHSSMHIGVAKAPHYEGPYTVVVDQPIFGVDRVGEVEDPTIWKTDSGYHLLVKDQRGSVTGQTHAGIQAVSQDGIQWKLCDHPIAYTKTVRWDDGTVETMGRLERVWALLENGIVTHLFFATMEGSGGLNESTRSWNIVIPLRPPQ